MTSRTNGRDEDERLREGMGEEEEKDLALRMKDHDAKSEAAVDDGEDV